MIKLKKIVEQISTLGTSTGAKLPGYKSPATSEKERQVSTFELDIQKHRAEEPGKYTWLVQQKPIKGQPIPKPILKTGPTPPKGVKSTKNPLWTKWSTLLIDLEKAKGQAEDDLGTSKRADTQDTVPTDKPPVGVTQPGKPGKKKREDESMVKLKDLIEQQRNVIRQESGMIREKKLKIPQPSDFGGDMEKYLDALNKHMKDVEKLAKRKKK
tara:strand:- start:331 stop:966 length:636 start_codon:yes stop_codon:yes gene_type:complete